MDDRKKRAIERLQKLKKPRSIIFLTLVNIFYFCELLEWFSTGKVWFVTTNSNDPRISFHDHPGSFVFVIALCFGNILLFFFGPALTIFQATRADRFDKPSA